MSDTPGVQSTLDVNEAPTVGMKPTSVSTWAWIWFIVAVLVIVGFHVKVFGHPIPPSPNFP